MLYERFSSYADFVATFAATGCTVHDFGLDTDGVNMIKAISYGDLATKPAIVIFNQHPNEWVAPHFILEFMRLVANGGFADPKGNDIRDTFAFYAVPTICPWGYPSSNPNNNNKNGVNLNRNWAKDWASFNAEPNNDVPFSGAYKGTGPASEVETQLINAKILELKPILSVDCHTSPYSGIHKGAAWPQWTEMLTNAYDALAAAGLGAYQIAWSQAGVPASMNWTGAQASNWGNQGIIPGFMEASHELGYPSGSSLMLRYGINTLFVHAAYAHLWHTDRKMSFKPRSVRPRGRMQLRSISALRWTYVRARGRE